MFLIENNIISGYSLNTWRQNIFLGCTNFLNVNADWNVSKFQIRDSLKAPTEWDFTLKPVRVYCIGILLGGGRPEEFLPSEVL